MGNTVMMDTNVFGALNRANSAPGVAKSLIEMQAAGDKLVVTRAAYAEIMNTPGEALRNAQLQQIKDFKMEIQPDVAQAEFVDIYRQWAELGPKQAGVSYADMKVIADVRAYMKNNPAESVEFFTVEKMANNQGGIGKTYGIKFSRACRLESNLGEITPYDPVKLGVRSAEAPAAPEIPPAIPEIPLPNPGPGSTETFMSAAKSGFKQGLKGLWSVETGVGIAAAVFMAACDLVAMKEAIKKIQIKFILEGFGKGVAAGAMGWSDSELASNSMNRVTLYRLQGLADPAGYLDLPFMFKLAQSVENYAVGYGYYFGSAKSLEWKKDWCARGFALLNKYGYYFGDDPDALFEYDCLQKFAWAMRAASDAIAVPGIKFS